MIRRGLKSSVFGFHICIHNSPFLPFSATPIHLLSVKKKNKKVPDFGTCTKSFPRQCPLHWTQTELSLDKYSQPLAEYKWRPTHLLCKHVFSCPDFSSGTAETRSFIRERAVSTSNDRF